MRPPRCHYNNIRFCIVLYFMGAHQTLTDARPFCRAVVYAIAWFALLRKTTGGGGAVVTAVGASWR